MAVNSLNTLGIPAVALFAYRNAERMMAASDPRCGMSWGSSSVDAINTFGVSAGHFALPIERKLQVSSFEVNAIFAGRTTDASKRPGSRVDSWVASLSRSA
jgi:hypothetical protein